MEPQFTQADQISLDQLNQAMSQAQKSFDDGVLEEPELQQLQQMIQQRMAPIQQRKQAADEGAKKAQEEEMTRQHSHLQAMEDQAAQYRAQQFNSRIVPVRSPWNPLSVAMMYEKSPNQWEMIQFPPVDTGDEDMQTEEVESGAE